MRSSVVSLTCAAGALVLFLSCAAGASAQAACCDAVEEFRHAAVTADAGAEAAEAASHPKPEAKPEAKAESRAEAKAEAPKAAPKSEAKAAPTPLDLSAEEVADGGSYADVFRILSRENSCSDFFGGPRLALTAFNRLATRLRRRPLGTAGVGVLMSGGYTVYRDADTGETYRLFEEAFINSDGPFAARVASPWSSRMQVGRFPAETRQAKALILLHELGHLVAAPAGGWLLPDDGTDPRQSERNTQAVESRCLKQLLALKV